MPAAASNPALLTSAECRPVLPESAAPALRGRRARWPASRRSIAVLLAVTTALGVGPPTEASARDAGPGPTATGNTYRLAATWTGVPSATQAGRFLGAADVSSLPDRTILVLGRAEGLADGARLPNDLAVHVLAPDGTGLALLPLGNELESAEHLDAGFAQTFFVLGRTVRGVWRVLEIGRDGTVVRRIDIDQEGRARDLAASPAGSFYVVKAAPDGGPDRVEIYGNLGQLAGSIVPDRARPGGDGDPYSYSLGRMDVDPGGVLYVMAHADRHCPTATPPPTSPVPTAEPTRRPSLGRGSQTGGRQAKTALDRTASPAQTDCTRELVLVYGPDHRFREALANAYVGDIAVGPSGVFVSSAGRRPPQRIYELRGQRLAYTCSAPEALDVPLPMGASEVRLDVDASGTVLGGTDLGEPFYRGAIAFGDPRQERPSGYRPRALGVYDRPRLGGPTFPRRLDATGALAVLEAPHQAYGPSAIANTHVDVQHDAEAVQRWTLDGRLMGQQVYHDQLLRDGSAASGEYHIVDPLVDVAVDGDDTYMIANQVIWFRPDSLPPTWYQHVPGTHFIAASADDGRVAVLNDAARRVLVLARSGRVVSDRPIAEDWSDRLASDLALDGDRLYLADEGRGSILVRGLDGTDHGEWPVYDAPRRLSVGAEGDLYVIGRSGYGLRYTADGRLVAHWRVPQRHAVVKVEPTDLAVGDDGRVYVTFVGLSEPGAQAQPPERRAGWDIAAGGVWVFEPSDESVDPLPPPDRPRCTVDADKSAAPGQVTLGEPVTVTLRLEGECPGHHEPQQLMLVMDTSWSMHDLFYPENPTPGALRRAQDVLSALLAAIDPGSVEIGLVTFSDGAQVAVPLPGDLGEVRSKVLTRRADGDTVMGAAVQLAHQELRGAHGRPDRRQTIVVVTDGLFHDQPKQAIDAARADGIEVAVIVMTTQGLDQEARARLVEAIGDPELVFVDPLPETASRLVTRISTWVPSAALLQSAVVVDELPDNMVYVSGSARPAATYEAPTRTLRWDLEPAPAADGVVLSYVVVPADAGHWPTNVRARAEYRDGSGSDGVTEFPVPRVQVNLPLPTPTPTSSPTVTPTATASTTPTPTSTPRTSWSAYLPIAAQPANCIGKAFHADVVLVLDVSTTMSARTPGGRTKLQAEIDAARLFIRLLVLEGDRRGHDQVAIVAFNDRAWPVAGLTRDEAMAQGSLDGLEGEVREGTRIDLALDEAGRALGSLPRDPDRVIAVVLLTDGRPNRVPTPVPSGGQEQTVLGAADRLKGAGVRIYTIGLGEPDEVWSWLMERIASRPAFYHYSLAGEDLADIYREILGGILCGREG